MPIGTVTDTFRSLDQMLSERRFADSALTPLSSSGTATSSALPRPADAARVLHRPPPAASRSTRLQQLGVLAPVAWRSRVSPGDRERSASAARRFHRPAHDPLRWLHATVLLVGRAADLPQADLDQMLTKARLKLNGTPPSSVTLGRVIYHPEGIVLPMTPASALAPIFEAAQAATLEVTGTVGITSTPGPSWVPHMTLCYSTSQQPAAPIIAALGRTLPDREVTIDKLSLVVQHGSALSWDWRPVGTVRLNHHDGIEPACGSLRNPLSRLSPSPVRKDCAGPQGDRQGCFRRVRAVGRTGCAARTGFSRMPPGAALALPYGSLFVSGRCVLRQRTDQGTGRRCWLRRLPLVVKTPPHASRTEQERQMSR